MPSDCVCARMSIVGVTCVLDECVTLSSLPVPTQAPTNSAPPKTVEVLLEISLTCESIS